MDCQTTYTGRTWHVTLYWAIQWCLEHSWTHLLSGNNGILRTSTTVSPTVLVGCGCSSTPGICWKSYFEISLDAQFNTHWNDKDKVLVFTWHVWTYFPLSLQIEQQFSSPGWPTRYYRNQDCTWTIIAPVNYTIHLQMSVRLEPRDEDGTCFDKVTVSPGKTEILLSTTTLVHPTSCTALRAIVKQCSQSECCATTDVYLISASYA